MLRSKDNIINTESTKKIDPTKRLDKVDGATGRIVYNTNYILEVKDKITRGDSTKIGHTEHKMPIFTNDSRAYVHFKTS